MRTLFGAFAIGSQLILAGCNVAKSNRSNDCLDLPVYPPPGIADLKQETIACVERNAALYAKGPDTPEAISKAVEIKCQPQIMNYVEKEARDAGEKPQYGEALEAWRQHALPVIAEARATGCYS